MNRRYIIIFVIGLTILAGTVWRGYQEIPKQPESYQLSNGSATGRIYPKRIEEPGTKEEREAKIKEKGIEFAKTNNAPISFFGRVVDQDGNPLQDVEVDFTVTAIPTVPVPWGSDQTSKGSCLSDKNGLFTVDGKRGVSLGINSLRKSGYRESGYYQQGHSRYEPNSAKRHIADRGKPVEFTLIRDDLPKAEQVSNQRLRFNWNAGATTIDLGPDIGKLEFFASRAGRDAAHKIKKFDWEVKMRAIGFAFTKLSDENEKIAPLSGYGPTVRIGFLPDEETWSPEVRASYAILTNSGVYGLMNFTIYGDRDDGGMNGRVTVYLNTSGSRNIDHK